MQNTWRVFRRDVGRIARVSKAWIIIIGVIVTPSLYAWFNIVAFWDPYSNTEHISVAIVNLDEGASSELTGDIDVGAQVVEQLRQNDQLGWRFLNEEDAMDEVRSGRSYAAIVIPADFSSDLISVTTGEFTRPALKYYVNEKANAIAPKITDVGASTLDTQINSTFVSTVAEAAAEELKDAGEDARLRLLDAKDSTVTALDDAVGKVADARERIGELDGSLGEAERRLTAARGTLGKIDTTLGQVQSAVSQAQALADEAQQELLTFTDTVTGAYVSGATLLADASAKLNASVRTLSSAVQQAGVEVDSAIRDLDAVIAANGEALDELKQVLEQSDPQSPVAQRLRDAIDRLQERGEADRTVLAQLQQLNTDITQVAAAIQGAAGAADDAAQNAATSAAAMRGALLETIPDLNRAMAALSSSAGAFSSALDAQRTQVGQAQNLLDDLRDQLSATSAALTALDGNLAGAEAGLEGVRTDVLALSGADAWNRLQTLTGLDAQQIAEFMASPVEVDEHAMFPVAAYGSAMAPLFTNLSLWIGAFVLMVILRLEVDTEGIPGLTVRQAYMGRWMLLAVIAVLQAVLVTVGNMVIGVQTANAFAFVGTAVLIGLAYLSIIYALSVCFGYVGKGLSILLVIMQIPGASGLYPIEMMPGFFRALNPILPFTYGIDALRETISGFYGGHYWRFMGALAVFVALAFILGLFLRQRLGNFAQLFNRRIADTQLLVSEDVHVVGGRNRLSHIVRALAEGEEYRRGIRRRARLFSHRYPLLLRITFLVGIAGMAVLGLIAWLAPTGKGTLLGLWVLWCLLLIGFLVALEYVKQSIQVGLEVERMPERELQRQLVAESTRTQMQVLSEEAVLPERMPEQDVHEQDAHEQDAAEEMPADEDATSIDELFAETETETQTGLEADPGADPEADAEADTETDRERGEER